MSGLKSGLVNNMEVLLTNVVAGIHKHYYGTSEVVCKKCGKPILVGSKMEKRSRGCHSQYYHKCCFEACQI